MIEGGLKRISTLGSRYNQVPSSEENKENNVISMTTTFDLDDEKCINFEGQIVSVSNCVLQIILKFVMILLLQIRLLYLI